jgi:Holliday junction DNA helicase RuvA
VISTLRGTIAAKSPTDVVVDVQGVGYGVSVPLSTSEAIGPPGAQVTLHTHLHVREDALQLFGFATPEEREMFLLLIGVNGIGPRLALGVLSGIGAGDLRRHLAQGNAAALTAAPGIGRKLAERLVLELRGKAGRAAAGGLVPDTTGDPAAAMRNEALLALLSLGYSRPGAEKALQDALRDEPPETRTVERLLKSALRRMTQ